MYLGGSRSFYLYGQAREIAKIQNIRTLTLTLYLLASRFRNLRFTVRDLYVLQRTSFVIHGKAHPYKAATGTSVSGWKDHREQLQQAGRLG